MNQTDARPLPLRLEDIDADWMTRALRTRAPGVTCEGIEVVDLIKGTCTKIRLRLSLDDAGRAAGIPELVILKGGFEEHSRAMSLVHDAEVRGYRDVFPVVDLPVPTCYFADFDPSDQQGIVILEDLLERDVAFCSALVPQSFEQSRRRLDALARFHAQTWQSAELEPGGRWHSFPEGEAQLRDYMNRYLEKPEEWRRFVLSPRGACTSVRFHDLGRIVSAFDKLVTISRRLPHCIVHGDTHLGNLYHNADGSPGFLDSLPGRGPGIREVCYHLVGALDTDDRRRWEGALVQHYLETLSSLGVEAPSLDAAMEQYAAFLLDGYIIFMVNESFYQPESINTAYTARFSTAMIDHATLRVIDDLDRKGGPRTASAASAL
ncbi:phosphotransferase [Sphingomonas solaris]|nr:phosphotransferase [Sphingomonas solaris]